MSVQVLRGDCIQVMKALKEGFNCILIEREPDYLKLIKARLDRREPTLWDWMNEAG